MIRPSAALVLCGVAMSVAAPAAAPTMRRRRPSRPSIRPGALRCGGRCRRRGLDNSGYRGNNGLGPLTVDPELMRLAAEQARSMAAHDKMAPISGGRSRSASAIRSSAAASRSRTFPPATTRWPRRFPAGAIAAASRQHAQSCRHAAGHRRGLCAGLEVQGVLGADPRRARRAAGVAAGRPFPQAGRIKWCRLYRDGLLTSVPVSATSLRISLNRGTPFRKACLKGGAGAVPAGGIANPHPGGFGHRPGRHYDRSARCSLHWRRGGSSRLHPVIPGSAARS